MTICVSLYTEVMYKSKLVQYSESVLALSVFGAQQRSCSSGHGNSSKKTEVPGEPDGRKDNTMNHKLDSPPTPCGCNRHEPRTI